MARVVKHGDGMQEREVTCENCRSVVAYTEADVRAGGFERQILCPACGKWTPAGARTPWLRL